MNEKNINVHASLAHRRFSLDVLKAVKTRRSIRSYLDKPIEDEKLMKVLEAARLSPSAVNLQPWDFVVVKDKTAKEYLLQAYNRQWFAKAPVIIVVCASPEKAWRRSDGEEFWKIDAAIAMQGMVLAATAEGLGTCWIGAFDEKKAKEALGVPENVRVVAMMPLGYAAEKKGPVTERKPLEQIVHSDHW
jgi:nitroreductase